jgi:hypothetical protein
MKNKFFTLLIGAIIGLGIWSALAFSDRDASKDVIEVNMTEEEFKNFSAESFAPRSAPIRVTVTGAIASSENDTLTFPYKLDSNGTLLWSITRANVSGTTNIAGLMQMSASAATTPTDWLHCDSTTTTTATTFHIRRDNVHGSRLRTILDGRGTQSSTYTVIWLFKPTN